MAVSISDVARRAGVSTSTVSYVLNNGPRQVTPSLTARVLEAVKELDYRPSRIARSMVTGRSGVLGVVHARMRYEGHGATFVQTVMNGVAAEAQRSRFDLLVYTNAMTDAPEQALSDVLDGRSDGLIVIAPGKSSALIDMLVERSVKMVAVSGYRRPSTPFLMCDNEHGTRAALDHLFDLGHRSIATLYGDLTSRDGRERYDAYQTFIDEKNLISPRHWKQGGRFDPERAKEWTRKLFAETPYPTAIVAANDEMAEAAMSVLRSLGLRVPQDVSVVGFDDTVLSLLTAPTMTTVAQPLESMGAMAVRNLIALMDGQAVPNLVRFPTQLLVRESTAPARG